MREKRYANRGRAIRMAVAGEAAALMAWAMWPMMVRAGVDASGSAAQTFYNITTSGATALGNLNRQSGGQLQITRLGNAVGDSTTNFLLINDTKYWNDNFNIAQGLNPTSHPGNQDYWNYQFHETGSVEGILELADSYGLTVNGVVGPVGGTVPNPWWTGNGNQITNGTTPYTNTRVQLAWSDVKTIQAFAKGSASNKSINARPDTDGYGFGRGAIGGTDFQKFRNIASITGNAGDQLAGQSGQQLFRNETVAIVPFTVSANPGTGLETLQADDVKWLNTTGRLQNGANFNSVTRDGGSGTRNELGNNLGFDPSYASGERDRIYTGANTYSVVAPDGTTVNVHTGDEAAPLRSLIDGNNVLGNADRNEDRAGVGIHFSDKTSGGSRLRPTVLASRMGVGAMSATDAGAFGRGTDANDQLRVLKINFDNDNNSAHFYQPKAEEVTTGQYKMWGQEQAITVVPTSWDGVSTAVRDDQDQTVRKFVNNITNSNGQFPNFAVDGTPADGILTNGFIIPDFMAVTKDFDGETQISRARPKEADYQTWKTDANGGQKLNWADPAAQNGYSTTNGVYYDIYNAGNNNSSSHVNASTSIEVTAKTALAGDFSQDGVRDKEDVQDLAKALATPSNYLVDKSFTAPKNGANPGGPLHSNDKNLIVLGDLNSDGVFDKKDARFFVYGATIDTTDASNAALTAAYGHSAATATAQERRSIGVRTGKLQKNVSIGIFNTQLQDLVNLGSITQGAADALKLNKFDVNGDNLVTRADAIIVDRNIGKDYTNLIDVLGTTDDLVAAEFQDDLTITHVLSGGTSDFKMIHDYLGSGSLLDGDANIDGRVDIQDLAIMLRNWMDSVDRWSMADFTFDGVVDRADLGLLARNWQGSAGSPGGGLGEAMMALGVDPNSIPEPASVGLIGLGAVGFLRRRRR